MKESLVSIIMPAYNAEKYIEKAISSVLNQTYYNWELIICDDCSTDDTKKIIKKYSGEKRIKLIELKRNSGAAIARNTAIKDSKGDFIAFLDSDDLWDCKKLSIQIKFMQENNYLFSCTYYNKIDSEDCDLNIISKYPKKVDFKVLLKQCPGNSTVIYNKKQLRKFYIPSIKKRNDYLMWFQVIEHAKYLYCMDKILSSHRVVEGSLSNKKIELVKYHWIIYKRKLRLGNMKSIYYCLYWIIQGIKKKLT